MTEDKDKFWSWVIGGVLVFLLLCVIALQIGAAIGRATVAG